MDNKTTWQNTEILQFLFEGPLRNEILKIRHLQTTDAYFESNAFLEDLRINESFLSIAGLHIWLDGVIFLRELLVVWLGEVKLKAKEQECFKLAQLAYSVLEDKASAIEFLSSKKYLESNLNNIPD